MAGGKLEEAHRAAEEAQSAAAVGWVCTDHLTLGSIAYY
jgi:hypothetical protein